MQQHYLSHCTLYYKYRKNAATCEYIDEVTHS